MNHQRWAEEQRLSRHHLETLRDEIKEKLGPRYLQAFDMIDRSAADADELEEELAQRNEIAKRVELIGDVNDPDADPYDAIILWLKRNRSILYQRVSSRSKSPG